MAEPDIEWCPEELTPIRKAFEEPDLGPIRDAVNELAKKVGEDIRDVLFRHMEDNLALNLEDWLMRKGRAIASRYIAEALAGDDARMRQLLGLQYAGAYTPNDWRIEDHGLGQHAELVAELVKRHRGLVQAERIKQLKQELGAVRRLYHRERQRNQELREGA